MVWQVRAKEQGVATLPLAELLPAPGGMPDFRS